MSAFEDRHDGGLAEGIADQGRPSLPAREWCAVRSIVSNAGRDVAFLTRSRARVRG